MSAVDKARNAAHEAKGRVKEGIGRLTGHDHLQAEGKSDQAAAHIKQAAEKAKDSIKHGAEAVKDKVKEGVGKVTGDDKHTAEGQTDQDAAQSRKDPDR